MNDFLQWLRGLPLLGPVLRHRFVKFGTVGFSGTLVNLAMLYLGQEYIFSAVEDTGYRLNLALGLAIFLATLNNYVWNRLWTWRDRMERLQKGFWLQLFQYFTASWVAIVLQVTFTKLFADHMHYMMANVSAIVLSSIVNYLVNDFWTFGLRNRKAAARAAERETT